MTATLDDSATLSRMSGLLGRVGGGGGGGASAANFLTSKVVWVDATAGSDATGARNNAAKPFATIEAAVTAAVAGDTVFVHPGSYTPTASISKDNIQIWCEEGVSISYNTTLITGLSNGATFKLMGRAAFTATGTSQRLVNVSGSTPDIFVEIESHAASAAGGTHTIRIDGDARLYLSVFKDFVVQNTTTAIGVGNGFSSSSSSRIVAVINGDLTNTSTGAAVECRQSGQGFIRASRIRATGGGAAVTSGGSGSTNWHIEADEVAGGSAGVTITATASCSVRARTITASAGPGISLTASTTITVLGCDNISGTTFGVTLSTGTVTLDDCRNISASAGPGISISGGTCIVSGSDTISGTTFGIDASGGTLNITGSRSISASGGPGLSVSGATVRIAGNDSISGTTRGVLVTAGTCTITPTRSISGSAGPGLEVQGGTVYVDGFNTITGTTRGVLAAGSAGPTLTLRGTDITGSAGPGLETSPSAGTVSIVLSAVRAITGTTRGIYFAPTGTGVVSLLGMAQRVVASAGSAIESNFAGPADAGCDLVVTAAISGTTAGINLVSTTAGMTIRGTAAITATAATGGVLANGAGTYNVQCGSIVNTGGPAITAGTSAALTVTVATNITGSTSCIVNSGTGALVVNAGGRISTTGAGTVISITNTGTATINASTIVAANGAGLSVTNGSTVKVSARDGWTVTGGIGAAISSSADVTLTGDITMGSTNHGVTVTGTATVRLNNMQITTPAGAGNGDCIQVNSTTCTVIVRSVTAISLGNGNPLTMVDNSAIRMRDVVLQAIQAAPAPYAIVNGTTCAIYMAGGGLISQQATTTPVDATSFIAGVIICNVAPGCVAPNALVDANFLQE